MYEIKIKVLGNGTLNTGSIERLRFGTANEIARSILVFDIDDSVEGKYHYLKFVKNKVSILYRITSNVFTLSRTILSSPGVWLFSFISTISPIVNEKLTGSYAYISEPIEAVVVDGIFSDGSPSEEEQMLKDLFGMSFGDLVIPDCVEAIGDYFLYNSRKAFNLHIGKNVKTIGSYAFYDAMIPSLTFAKDTLLNTLNDNAFANINFENCVTIPKSVSSWGKYCFKNSNPPELYFELDSKLESLGSYALWENHIAEIRLPDKLKIFCSGNTSVIKNCNDLGYIWFPNTITNTIPAYAITNCPLLEDIELEVGFNTSANFSNCTGLTKDSIVKMFNALKNLSGQSAKSLTLGQTNLAKVTSADILIATNKNWTIS